MGGGIKFRRNNVNIEAYAEVDRENAKLIIYNADTFVINIPFINKQIRTGGKGSFAYDIDEWLARYGRPTELLLALHISTMMPDLTYEIATAEEFNTKVNLGINQVTVNYYVNWTDESGKEWKEQDLMDEFINNLSYAGEDGYIAVPQKYKDGYNRIISRAKSDEEFKLQFYKSCAKSMEANNEDISDESYGGTLKVNVVYAAYKAAKDLDDEAFANELYETYFVDPEDIDEVRQFDDVHTRRWRIKNYMTKGRRSGEGLLEQIGDLIKGWIEELSDVITDRTECTAIVEYGPETDEFGNLKPKRKTLFQHWYSANVQNTLGISDYKFQKLHDLQAEGVEGIEHVQFPYISSVTKHWYYKDFYFPASENGVYYKARTASKMIKYDYVNGETERPLEGFDIMLDALLTAEDGNAVYYQVREPYTEGPNENIVRLFKDNTYYRYDGSPETARQIAIAKAADGDGVAIFQGEDAYVTGDQKEWGELPKKQKASFGTTQDTLSAFSILEGVHTENADWIYRRLKMLLVNLNFYSQAELSEPLKNVLVWLIKSNQDLPRYQPFTEKEIKWDVTKNMDNFGIDINNVEGETIICPGDAEVVSTSGDSITLKFKALSSNTFDFLDYEYAKRFFVIDRAVVEDYTMTISGINVSVGGGEIGRGKELGTAKEKVNVIMQRPDLSIVGEEGDAYEDNIEDYMSQFYTNKHEEELIKRYEDRKPIATDHGGPEGSNSGTPEENPDNEDREEENDDDGLTTENPEPPVGNSIDYVYAKVASEAQANYESALAVASCAANRVDSTRYAGSTMYDVLYAPGQFVGNHSKFISNGKYTGPDVIKKAVDDCMNGIRNHGFTSFRTGTSSEVSFRAGKIKSDTGCSDAQLSNYVRLIGGNNYFNNYNNHYYKEYTK